MDKDQINELIIKKIKESSADDKIKNFMIKILNWEKYHYEDVSKRKRFSEDYLKMIEICYKA